MNVSFRCPNALSISIALLFVMSFQSYALVAAESVKFDVAVLEDSVPASAESVVRVGPDGTIQIAKTTTAAFQLTRNTALPAGDLSLQFEAFCLGKVTGVKLKAKRPNGDAVSLYLPNIQHSEASVTYTADLYTDLTAATDLQLFLNLKSEASVQISAIRVVPRPVLNKSVVPSTTAETAFLSSYLDKKFRGQIKSVSATKDQLVVSGQVPAGMSEVSLVEIPMASLLTSSTAVRTTLPVSVKPDRTFEMAFPRYDQGRKDRALSRWRLMKNSATKPEPISHCRYTEDVACMRPDLPAVELTSKKGLGGWHLSRSEKTRNDLQDLGVTAVTININALHNFVSIQQKPGWFPFEWQGQTYFANPHRLDIIDRTLLEAQQHNLMVSAVLLVTNPKGAESDTATLLANPEADLQGIFAMPNVTSEESLQYYGAILKLMAERWTRPDGRYGRIHHWIMHNEVDFGWVWTNAGRKSDVQFMSLYQRSMRLADLIVRQYDPNARVWISLTHHWASTGNSDGYGSKRMLELLLKFCQAEGDFPWAVAYHPYPQNLRDPRTWKDEQAAFHFDTYKITPNNIEVLDAWMKLPEMKYRGEVRPVHLSENGFNSPDYSEAALRDQAAGMALAWKKIERLSSIKMWHYHNWIDNRHEGGLRIGLRKFPDHKEDPYGKKPIWHLYEALGTDRESKVLGPYLPVIGVSSWDELVYLEPIRK